MRSIRIPIHTPALLALAAASLPAHASPGEHSAMMARLSEAASSGRVRVVEIGKSVEGRSIPLAILGPDAPVRLMVLCRQHGDETVSTGAALSVIRRAAAGDPALSPARLKAQVLLVPMVNPDGAERGARANARGVDLNRDWRLQSQPEVRAVLNAYRRFAPQVVLDEHEWTPNDPPGADSLEMSAAPNAVRQSIGRMALGAGTEAGIPLAVVRYRATSDPRLAHRYFTARGATAFLLETTPARSKAVRAKVYEGMIVRMAGAAGRYAPPRPVPMGAAGLPPLFGVPSRTVKAPQPLRSPVPVIPLCTVGFALLLAGAFGRPRLAAGAGAKRRGALRRVPLSDVAGLTARLERRRAAALRGLMGGTETRGLPSQPSPVRAPLGSACSSRMSSTSPRVSPERRAISSPGRPSPASRQTSRRARVPASGAASRTPSGRGLSPSRASTSSSRA